MWQIIGQSSGFGIFIYLVLVFMSLTSWTIVFHKFRQFRAMKRDNDGFLQHFKRSRQLDEIAGQARTYKASPLANMYAAGFAEMTHLRELRNEAAGLGQSTKPLGREDFELVEMAMDRSFGEEIAKLERQVIFLATTGSSAPFMGLLGTVVGIMDSFWSIGERGSASLAVVAPGIAEALLATIIGLAAAIPAVIAFNWANNRLKQVNNRAQSFILDFIGRAKKEAL